MRSEDSGIERVRFYGAGDLGTYWQVERAADLAERFDPADAPTSAADMVELYNVQQYAEAGFFPRAYTDAQRAQAEARIPVIRSVVARFFTAIDDTNVAELVAGIAFEYHADLLELLGRNKAFERCDAGTMLPALKATGVNLGEMLANNKLAQAYDTQLCEALLADVRNAELLVRKYMQKDVTNEIHLPRSFGSIDARELLQGYVDSADANPNYIGLIETAPVNNQTGVDARLKLRAKRRKDRMTEEFFNDHTGVKTGCEVGISDTQDDPVKVEMDGMVATFTYSGSWLDQTADNPSILNNFQHLRVCRSSRPAHAACVPSRPGRLREISDDDRQDRLSPWRSISRHRYELASADASLSPLPGVEGHRPGSSDCLVLRGLSGRRV